MRHDGKGHQEGPVDVGIDNGGLAIGVRLPKRNSVIADEVLSVVGIVDRDVNGAKFVHCFLDGPLAIGAAGDIRDYRQRTACAGDVVNLVCDRLIWLGDFAAVMVMPAALAQASPNAIARLNPRPPPRRRQL